MVDVDGVDVVVCMGCAAVMHTTHTSTRQHTLTPWQLICKVVSFHSVGKSCQRGTPRNSSTCKNPSGVDVARTARMHSIKNNNLSMVWLEGKV